MTTLKNIFEDSSSEKGTEIFEQLLSNGNFILERIISEGHSSPENFWYDQEKNEFVILLSGSARISFEDGKIFDMAPGDYLIINARQKHRVDWTDPHQKTYWMALHY